MCRGVGPAYAVPDDVGTLLARATSAGIVHLRMASPGMAVHAAGTHPFAGDGIAFAHNGFITPTDGLRELVAGYPGFSLDTRFTDSQMYFEIVRHHVAGHIDPLDGVIEAVARIRAHFPTASLNALLLTSRTLIAVHASHEAVSPLRASPRDRLPVGHADSYFRMYSRRRTDGSTVITSSGVDVSGWEPLPPESLLAVDIPTGQVITRFLNRLSR